MTLEVFANEARIPAVGLGTWGLRGENCEHVVLEAIRAGYRHVDTAQMYENERDVGRGIKDAIAPREDIFLTTKIWPDQAHRLEAAAEESLKRLDTDHVDLLLIHWPSDEMPFRKTMEALGRAKRDGLARHVGISNFPSKLVEAAVAHCPEPLVTNQVEYHPYLDQTTLLATCRKHGVSLTAYSPLAKGRVFQDPVLREIGEAHGKTPGQVTVRWLIQQEGVVAIPRSTKVENAVANGDVDDFQLTVGEMGRIFDLAEPDGRLVDPDWAPDWDEPARRAA